MRIAFLTPEYPHTRIGPAGGIGTGLLNLCAGLLAAGHEPVILAYGQPADDYFEEGGIQFHLLKNVRLKGLSWWLTRKKLQRLINGLHREGRIDIVEAPDWTGISAFIRATCPMVIRLNGSDTYFCHLDKRPVRPFNKFLERRALRDADGHISVSAFTASVTNAVFGLDIDFEIIPNSVEVSRFVQPQSPPTPDTILYFGTLIRKKGLLELPGIFNEVIRDRPAARLILAGRDSGDSQTGSSSTWSLMQPLFSPEALAATHYVGPVDYANISQHIANASVCVFPTFAEALPLSWLEAMAMEKAIVASNIGWAPEVIDDGLTGFLAHPTDHQKFASRIVQLLADRELTALMGKRARQRVIEHFDTVSVAGLSVAFYTRFL